MIYDNPPHLDHATATQILRAGLAGEQAEPDPNRVLIGLALYDDDQEFVETWCVRIARDAGECPLRDTAAMCIGVHLARRFGSVSDAAASVVRELADDEQRGSDEVWFQGAAEELEWNLRPRSRWGRLRERVRRG